MLVLTYVNYSIFMCGALWKKWNWRICTHFDSFCHSDFLVTLNKCPCKQNHVHLYSSINNKICCLRHVCVKYGLVKITNRSINQAWIISLLKKLNGVELVHLIVLNVDLRSTINILKQIKQSLRSVSRKS